MEETVHLFFFKNEWDRGKGGGESRGGGYLERQEDQECWILGVG